MSGRRVGASEEGLLPLVLVPATADRVAGIIAACAGITVGVVGGVFGRASVFALAVCALLLVVARAALARQVTADADGVSFHDGLWSHQLRWDDVDDVVAAESGVHLLHGGRFIDRLPLPGTRFARAAAHTTIADQLNEIRLSARGDEPIRPCPARIEGGLRWRLGTTVVGVQPDGSLNYLRGPVVMIDLIGTLLRLSRKRQEAEQLREAEALRLGWNPT